MRACNALVILIGLLVACGIDSEPILGDQADAGAFESPDVSTPAGAPLTLYDGCDTTLECEADCAEDLDCPEPADRNGEPAALDLAADAEHDMAANEERWWGMEAAGNSLLYEVTEGAMTVAVYDQMGVLLGRSAPGEPGVLFVATVGQPIEVRAIAGAEGARFRFAAE